MENRPKILDLLEHPYFDIAFKAEFDNELGELLYAPKKGKSKIMLTPNFTPEPTSYMKIYNRKKSPNFATPGRMFEDQGKWKKPKVLQKNPEKSYFLPEILRKDGHMQRKKSIKYMKKVVEVKSDQKSTLKSTEGRHIRRKSRNPSLEHESSNESLVKSVFIHPVLSNRHQQFSKKEFSPLTPDQLPNVSVIPSKYRLKKHENLKATNSKSIIASSNNFSPIHK